MDRRSRTIKTVRLLMITIAIMYAPYYTFTTIQSYYIFYKHTYPGKIIDKLAAFSYVPTEMLGIINAVTYGIGNNNRNSVRDIQNK